MGEPAKSGSKTSEFRTTWASILFAVGAAATAIAMAPLGLPAAIVLAASTIGIGAGAAGYALSRGMAKKGDK